MSPFTAEPLVRFLSAAQRIAPDFAVMWETQVLAGLRPGEVYTLHVEDVVDESGAIRELLRVRRTVGKNGKTAGPPKTKSSRREVEITRPLRDRLASYVESKGFRVPTRVAALSPQGASPYLYNKPVGDRFKRALKLAGLPAHHSAHDLRHTFATLKNGAEMLSVSRTVGHASISMTVDLYGKWARPRRPESSRALDGLLAAARPATEKGGRVTPTQANATARWGNLVGSFGSPHNHALPGTSLRFEGRR